MTTRVPKLAAIYGADMPGLRVIGTKWTVFGKLHLLRREPTIPPAGPTNR